MPASRHHVERLAHRPVGLARQRAAMADQDLALEAVAQRRLGDPAQRDGRHLVGLVGVEIEVEPVLDRRAKHRVEQRVEIRHHVGDRAEHALGIGDPLGEPGEPRAIAHALDAEQAGAPAARCARAMPRASPRRPARRSSPAAPPSRDGCAAPWCRAHRPQRSAKSMRRSTSRAFQRTSRSVPVASSAPMNDPSGLGMRGQIWPLSIWVWQSTKQGSTMRPFRSMARGGAGLSARDAMPVILPSATAMSASAKPSPSNGPVRPGVSDACTRALVSTNHPLVGILIASRITAPHPHPRDLCRRRMAVTTALIYLSAVSALSCHRRSIRCEISDSSRKITIPVSEIRNSAAKSRGAFSR